MPNYWSSRLAEALRQSHIAPTAALRAVHVQNAARYELLLNSSRAYGNSVQEARLAA
jgi:hypothetical protein